MEREDRSSPPSVDPVSPPNPSPDKFSDEEEGGSVLWQAAALSREEVLRRRSKRLQKLEALYRKQYWALMEEMKNKHREYCWEHGKSPMEEEEGEGEDRNMEGEADLGLGLETGERKRCFFYGCKTKAMPLTKFCHQHILSDPKQTLYKQCAFVKCSQQSGQSICGKPVLKSAMPSLCQLHLQKSQKGIAQALKKAGLNPSASNNPVPKFSVLIAQSVRQIQARRIAFRTFKNSIAWKDGNAF